ncbi:hypothetical protein M514_04240 [Trichuris suis]|uniref:RRM domain-containing protein n=1 Tax=Trichuris suis TaxID=68888 RepID=A0A085NQD4_9BILA|nr:hypothetical protein M513_04240 [Trichuris suis]KFD71680.1 hypothetical protein M514_04240 [Trichuris suis]
MKKKIPVIEKERTVAHRRNKEGLRILIILLWQDCRGALLFLGDLRLVVLDQTFPLAAVVREKHLREIFKRFGSIEDVRIMKNSHGNYKMAIVRFRHSMSALEAVRFMDCGMIDNLAVNVEPLESRRRNEHRTKRGYYYR